MQWFVAVALARVVREGPGVLVQDQSLTFWPTVCIIQVNDPKQHYADPGAVFARHPCRGAEIVVLATQESPMIENSPDGNVGNLARRLFVTTKGSIQGVRKSYWFQG